MAVADLHRHSGIGWGDLVLLGVVLLGTTIPLGIGGDLPVSRGEPGRLLSMVFLGVYMVGLFTVAVAWRSLPTYGRLILTERADARDLATGSAGQVVLRGTVVDTKDHLRTPFREVPAVAYMTRVQSHDPDSRYQAPGPRKNWTTKWIGEDAAPFTVDDGSGAVRVDPSDARLYVTGWRHVSVSVDGVLPDHLRSFLDRTTASVRVDSDGENLRFSEAILAPGDEASVLGRANGGSVEAHVVAEGDHHTRLRRRVVLGGPFGLVATAVGYLELLGHAGLL